MLKEFSFEGVSFRYPSDWKLEQEEGDEGWTVSLQSPNTTFLTLTCDSTLPPIEEVAGAALEALRSEYPTLEAESVVESVAGQMAVGHDINFFSLDLSVTCWTRSFYCAAGTALLLCQSSDLELEESEPALRAICASLTVEEE
jgi:hypothetical protein